jgi:hypothetical protein
MNCTDKYYLAKIETAWESSQQYETKLPFNRPPRSRSHNKLRHLCCTIETLDGGRRRLPKEITEYSSNKIKRLIFPTYLPD